MIAQASSLTVTITIGVLSLRKKAQPPIQKEDDYRLVSVRDLALDAELLSATYGKVEP